MIDSGFMKQIARIHTDFSTKFGVPRQSGLINSLKAKIVLSPNTVIRRPARMKFSHIWLIWEFSAAMHNTWSPTIQPPTWWEQEWEFCYTLSIPSNPVSLSV